VDANLPGKSRSHDVILIGGSQGSIVALRKLLSGLPARFDAAIAITVHRSPTFVSALAKVVASHSTLPVVEPRDGQPFEPGIVYLAPQDHHLVFRGETIGLDRGPKHNFVRPAIDVMFTSGAAAFGSRVVGMLLTGNLSDGVSGLVHIKEHGGLSLAQDPTGAEAPSMPRNALVYDHVDAVFELSAGSRVLTKLAGGGNIEEVVGLGGVHRVPPKGPQATGPQVPPWGSNRLIHLKPNGSEHEAALTKGRRK
jgi:two-component system chemotaxis response regulator CheB